MKSIIKMPLNLTKTKIKGITTEDTIIIVKVEPYKSEQNRCPVCGKKCRVYDAKQTPKYWRAQDTAASATYLEYKPVRVSCPEHGVHVQKVPWADMIHRLQNRLKSTWLTYLFIVLGLLPAR